MTLPKNPKLVILARDGLVMDLRTELPRESLGRIENVADWLVGSDYLSDEYYSRFERHLKTER